MNRRKFIQNASLATAGGVIAGSLPAWASGLSVGTKHVVLAVVAGISREDFVHLFPKTFPHSLGNVGKLVTDMRYNGQAAGHRLALECILSGKYLPEKESGRTSLTSTILFTATGASAPKYVISTDRTFLKTNPPPALMNAAHFCISKSDIRGTCFPTALIRNADPSASKDTQVLEAGLNKRQTTYTYDINEDLLVAEASCEILQKEQPQILVAHFMGTDVAHSDVSLAKKNQETISLGLQRIWETISTHPSLKDTLLLVLPDFGRNTTPNAIKNIEGIFGTDHSTADENTKKIACLLASPKGLPKKIASSGESIDILPTLLHFLGAKIPADLPGKNLL